MWCCIVFFNAAECYVAQGDDLVALVTEIMASVSSHVASVLFSRSEYAHLRTIQGPKLRTAEVSLSQSLLWKQNGFQAFAEISRREVSCFAASENPRTQVDDAAMSADASKSESENRLVEDGAQPLLSEDIDALGKIAESAAEKLRETLDASAGVPQAEETGEAGETGDAGFWRQVAMASDAGAALTVIAERAGISGGVVSNQECSKLILDALAQGNSELAFSVLKAMRGSVIQRRVERDGKHCQDSGTFSLAMSNCSISNLAI